MMTALPLIVSFSLVVTVVRGHGYLHTPPQRSSAWRFGFNTSINYNDNQLFCGGKYTQWATNGGKCGACGDPFNGILENEAGGKYATGTITGSYIRGQILEAKVLITAFHKGWFEFRLCAQNNVNMRVDQSCLDETVLEIVGNNTNRFSITGLGIDSGMYAIKLQLPADVTCEQCVLQWKYNTGNSWGCDDDGCGLGHGPQEQFINCADIEITEGGPDLATSSGSTSRTSSTATTTSSPATTVTATTAVPTTTTTTVTVTSPTTTTISTSNTPSSIPTTSTSSSSSSSSSSTSSPTTAQSDGTQVCRAAGAWKLVPGMDWWCQINCARGYCPASHCVCS